MRVGWVFLVAAACTDVHAQPASMAGWSDEGTFNIYANEERAGRMTFRWTPDGKFESTTTMFIAGQTSVSSVNLTPDSEGRWIKAVLDEPARKVVWERDGRQYKFTFPDKNGNAKGPDDVLTFESWTPPLMTLALHRFGAKGDASQTLPVMVLNADPLQSHSADLIVERRETIDRVVRGKQLQLTRWTYAPPLGEYQVVADLDGRVYVATGCTGFGDGIAPKNCAFVREGYEELRDGPVESGPISLPQYEVDVKPGFKIPMRDGVKLATDLYFPAGVAKAPVILIRTPYEKEMEELKGRYYARRGFVVAIQDVRGRFASEGDWEPFVHEAKDGYDTIEWLAGRPWSTGKVGMLGGSYLGMVQWSAASLHPPHLAAMIPNVSPPDPFHNFPFEGGSFALQASAQWLNIVETNATAEVSGVLLAKIHSMNFGEVLKSLPVIELDKAAFGHSPLPWRHWIEHSSPDGYWRETMFADKLKDCDVPVFNQSGWFDGDGVGTKFNYLAMASNHHATQKLIIGPWDHTDTASRAGDNRDYGPDAVIDLQRDYLRWFDHWLKGIDNGITNEPLVSLFVMGSNKWLRGPTYPLPQTRFEKLYLASGGRLSFNPPAGPEPADRYTYDPGDPTPVQELDAPPERKDVLVYLTKPLEKPYTFAGPLSAVLYASSSARDTDWFVSVADVAKDGKASPLWSTGSAGHVRARYRNSLVKAKLLTPGKTYEYKIDLWHTGVTIAKGHRLRVEISSASFPLFDRNLNTGGNNELDTRYVSAKQVIYHDAAHPSHIVLPMIPDN